jgi:hypothetical protein
MILFARVFLCLTKEVILMRLKFSISLFGRDVVDVELLVDDPP